MFTARVVVPTPPFGLKKATISALPECAGVSGWTLPVRMSCAMTRPSSSLRAKPPTMTSSAPGLEEGDLGLHVVGRRDDENRRDPIGAGGAQRSDRPGRGEALGNDEVELASTHGGHGIGR